MVKHNILFIRLDTHKVSTEVAHIEDKRGVKPIHQGKINTAKAAISNLAQQYQSTHLQAYCILFMKQPLVVIGFISC